MNKIWKLAWKLVPKQLLIDTGIKAMGKIIDGQVKPEEVTEAFCEIGVAISKFGNKYLGKNYEKFIENKIQIRFLDAASVGLHTGLDKNEQ